MLIRSLIVALQVAVLATVGACSSPSAVAPTSGPPAADALRLVSLQPQITETLFALGAGDVVVGRSDYDTLPAEVTALPSAGTALTPNVEAVVGLQPSHVLIEQTGGARTDLLEPLAELIELPWHQVADLRPSIERLGELTAHQDAAGALAAELEASLQTEPPSDGPRVLLTYAGPDLGTGPVWFVQRNSLHGAAMHAAGLVNAVDRDVSGAPSMSLEALVQVDPEVIVVLSAQDELADAERERLVHAFDALAPLQAPQSGRVVVLSGARFHSTGPALTELSGALKTVVAGVPAPEN